jgi:succinate dehydrogenase / fumarate reductase flavoprotein subunit
MQGLADGYFVIPSTIATYLATLKPGERPAAEAPEFKQAEDSVRSITRRLLSGNGKRTADSFHKELGRIMWDNCGMARNKAGLEKALKLIPELREEFWKNVKVTGSETELNQTLERAGRIADFLELAELMCLDALKREESCGGHFREEHQFPDGEARRDDENFACVAAWEYTGAGKAPVLNKEPLLYEEVKMSTLSYK